MSTKLVSSIAVAARSRLLAVRGDTPLRDVAQLLSSTRISLVVICDQLGTMVGVVTKSDIVRQMGHCTGRTCIDPAEGIMTKHVISCRATDGLSDVLSMMQARGLEHIPVSETEGNSSGPARWDVDVVQPSFRRHPRVAIGIVSRQASFVSKSRRARPTNRRPRHAVSHRPLGVCCRRKDYVERPALAYRTNRPLPGY